MHTIAITRWKERQIKGEQCREEEGGEWKETEGGRMMTKGTKMKKCELVQGKQKQTKTKITKIN